MGEQVEIPLSVDSEKVQKGTIGVYIGLFLIVYITNILTQPSTSYETASVLTFALAFVFGAVFSIYSSYEGKGIVVSYIFLLSPVVSNLLYHSWNPSGDSAVASTVGPGPFGEFGTGAWIFWIAISLIIGSICIIGGITLRWLKFNSVHTS